MKVFGAVTEGMMQRAYEASLNRDYSKPEMDHLRGVLEAALNIAPTPLLEVTEAMTKSGIEAYKLAMWRSLSYASTIEETLAHIYRSMAKVDPSRVESK